MRLTLTLAAAICAAGLAAAAPAHARLLEHGRQCGSNDHGRSFCPMDTRGGIHVKKQISRVQCVRGRNYFVGPRGVSVAHGCRATFVRNYFSHSHKSILDPRKG